MVWFRIYETRILKYDCVHQARVLNDICMHQT